MYFSLILNLEFFLGFGTIKAFSWRCTKLLPEVSPVGAVLQLFLGKSFPHPPGSAPPPVSFPSGSVPSRHVLGAVTVYYWGSLQYSLVQKTILWEIFSTFSSLPELPLEALPPREFPLGFGTIKASSWRFSGLLAGVSPVFDRTETILGEIFSTFARLPELSLKALPPREFPLGFGTIKASSWRFSGLLPGLSPVFDRIETILGEIFSPFARLPELSLEALPPREFPLGFGTIKASFWRCTKLLPEVSSVFDRTETSLGEIFSTSARLPELSLEALRPREPSLGFGTIKASFWRSTKLPSEVSPLFVSKAIVGTVSTSCATPHSLSREHVITKLSLRPIVDCRVFCNSFDAHAGWLRDRRGA